MNLIEKNSDNQLNCSTSRVYSSYLQQSQLFEHQKVDQSFGLSIALKNDSQRQYTLERNERLFLKESVQLNQSKIFFETPQVTWPMQVKYNHQTNLYEIIQKITNEQQFKFIIKQCLTVQDFANLRGQSKQSKQSNKSNKSNFNKKYKKTQAQDQILSIKNFYKYICLFQRFYTLLQILLFRRLQFQLLQQFTQYSDKYAIFKNENYSLIYILCENYFNLFNRCFNHLLINNDSQQRSFYKKFLQIQRSRLLQSNNLYILLNQALYLQLSLQLHYRSNQHPVNCVNDNIVNSVNKYNNFYIIENDFNPIIEIYSRNENRDIDIYLELIFFMNTVQNFLEQQYQSLSEQYYDFYDTFIQHFNQRFTSHEAQHSSDVLIQYFYHFYPLSDHRLRIVDHFSSNKEFKQPKGIDSSLKNVVFSTTSVTDRFALRLQNAPIPSKRNKSFKQMSKGVRLRDCDSELQSSFEQIDVLKNKQTKHMERYHRLRIVDHFSSNKEFKQPKASDSGFQDRNFLLSHIWLQKVDQLIITKDAQIHNLGAILQLNSQQQEIYDINSQLCPYKTICYKLQKRSHSEQKIHYHLPTIDSIDDQTLFQQKQHFKQQMQKKCDDIDMFQICNNPYQSIPSTISIYSEKYESFHEHQLIQQLQDHYICQTPSLKPFDYWHSIVKNHLFENPQIFVCDQRTQCNFVLTANELLASSRREQDQSWQDNPKDQMIHTTKPLIEEGQSIWITSQSPTIFYEDLIHSLTQISILQYETYDSHSWSFIQL